MCVWGGGVEICCFLFLRARAGLAVEICCCFEERIMGEAGKRAGGGEGKIK